MVPFAPSFPRLKFCGLTRTEDVTAAIECGADAIGLNFYEGSPRYVSASRASDLSQIASGHLLRVGVFVNAAPDAVASILESCDLDCIQLHGDESVEWLNESAKFPRLKTLPVIRAVAWRGTTDDVFHLQSWTAMPLAADRPWLGLLVDAHDPHLRGGTGKTARWDLLAPRPREFCSLPFLLAGGLTPDNLQSALAIAQPDGVDIASGIEVSPGIKDRLKMKRVGELVRAHYA